MKATASQIRASSTTATTKVKPGQTDENISPDSAPRVRHNVGSSEVRVLGVEITQSFIGLKKVALVVTGFGHNHGGVQIGLIVSTGKATQAFITASIQYKTMHSFLC